MARRWQMKAAVVGDLAGEIQPSRCRRKMPRGHRADGTFRPFHRARLRIWRTGPLALRASIRSVSYSRYGDHRSGRRRCAAPVSLGVRNAVSQPPAVEHTEQHLPSRGVRYPAVGARTQSTYLDGDCARRCWVAAVRSVRRQRIWVAGEAQPQGPRSSISTGGRRTNQHAQMRQAAEQRSPQKVDVGVEERQPGTGRLTSSQDRPSSA